ncbi:MAG: HpcH/HpaI aldolase/citrate lyase family protein [Selenomonadaceae bacterium]|nr:HpcH/HpaI aldolase/citrate lyase family protein [Selenomonadaceae bacterium]
MQEINPLAYRVGGLLYMPALQENIVPKIAASSIPCLSSLAFCLEDAIQDQALPKAEATLARILNEFTALPGEKLPLVFIRIRSPLHLRRLAEEYRDFRDIITGYILPKFDLGSATAYLAVLEGINRQEPPLYIMPILESSALADPATRIDTLTTIRCLLEAVKPYVLNIRVGGNDLLNLYGLRCPISHTIYDIEAVRAVLADILGVFAREYVVSAPVWNYFGQRETEPWAEGLKRELALDQLNGFIGKTAIHPAQLPLIHRSLMVSREDYADACALLNWPTGDKGVEKSVNSSRLNEVKCHLNWAKRIKILGDIYGVVTPVPHESR